MQSSIYFLLPVHLVYTNTFCMTQFKYLVRSSSSFQEGLLNIPVGTLFCNYKILRLFFLLFRATPVAWWSSQARGLNQSYSCQPTPQPQQHRLRATSATCTTAHSNTGSLTHWARPGIEPASSWFLVDFVNLWATKGTPKILRHF